jgi:hypothetical protein
MSPLKVVGWDGDLILHGIEIIQGKDARTVLLCWQWFYY